MNTTPHSITTRVSEVDGRALLDVSLLRSKAADLRLTAAEIPSPLSTAYRRRAAELELEAAALAAKAGVPGQVLLDVFSTSSAGCGVVDNALEKIIDRQFEGTGSHIATMHKDLTISLSLAEELGVPMSMAAQAMQLFHAGRSKFPQGDNWICTRVIEEIVGAELHR